MWSDLGSRFGAFFRRSRMDADLEAELRFHLDLEVEKLEKAGLPREEAIRRARLAFGGLDQVREECRDARGVRLLETLFRDLRYGIRLLTGNPVYTGVVVLTLALGIGANTAMLGAVYALVLRPYRFPGSDRVVSVEARHVSGTNQNTGYRDFLDWREQNRVFEEMAISPWTGTYTLTGMDDPQRVVGAATTEGFLRVLGITLSLGRFFNAEEDRPDAPRVAVLSYTAWEHRFGGSSAVLGSTLTLNGAPYTVIGVMPRGCA
jgi:putative ABC transport system permease protein